MFSESLNAIQNIVKIIPMCIAQRINKLIMVIFSCKRILAMKTASLLSTTSSHLFLGSTYGS